MYYNLFQNLLLFKRKNRFRFLKILLLFSLSCLKSYSATKTFTGPGNFGDATKWNGGTLPVAGDNLVINGSCTVNNSVASDNVAYGTLLIGNTSAGTLSWAASGTNRLNITTISSSQAGSSLNMTNGGKLILRSGTWTSTNLAFTAGSGTVELQASIILPAAYATYNNVIVNGAAISVNLGVNTVVNTDLTVTSGILSVGAFTFTVTGTVTVNGTLTITSNTGTKSFGNLIINGTFNNTASNEAITINGNFQNNGTFNNGTGLVTFTGATSNTVTGTAASTAFGGGIVVNKGTSTSNVLDVQCVITMLAGGLTLTNGVLKISSASTITPFTADIVPSPYLIPTTAGLWCNGATINTPGGGMTWSVQGLFRISAGTVNAGSVTGDWFAPRSGANIIVEGGNFNLADRISQVGESWVFNMTGGTMTINTVGSNTANRPPFNMEQTGCSFSMSGGTMIIERAGGGPGENLGYYNIAASGSGFTGGTLQIGDASTPASQTMRITTTIPIYNLTVNSANAIAQLYTNSITVTNNVSIAAGVLDANSLNISVGRNWDNSSAKADPFIQGSGTVTFNGSNAQTIGASIAQETFNNLTIANTNGGISLINSTDINITNILTMTSGIVTTGSDLVVLSNSTATNLSYTNGFINGNFRRYIASNTSTYLYPVGSGNTANKRHRISFVNNSLTGVSFLDASVTDFTQSAPNSDASLNTTQSGTAVTSTVGAAGGQTLIWTFTPNAAPSGGNFGVRIYVENTTLSSSNDNAFMVLRRTVTTSYSNFLTNDGTTFIPSYGGAGRIYNAGNGYAQRTANTTFGQFAIGLAVGPLPIKLVSFEAQPKDDVVSVSWITSSEINNDYFTVERSRDDETYEAITQVHGAGNSSRMIRYNVTDSSPLEGVSYYRLRQTDFDGNATFSNPALVLFNSSKTDIRIYPNPFSISSLLTITSSSQENNLSLVIYSVFGNKMNIETKSIDNHTIQILRNDLPTGLYFFDLNRGENTLWGKGKFIIE